MTNSIYYSDIDMELTANRNGDIQKDTNENAVRNSIKNILSTMQGDRRMLPTFALNVHSLLFDPIDETTAYSIGERILEAIEEWEDRVIIEEVASIPRYDQNRYDISISFRIESSQETQELNYILEKI